MATAIYEALTEAEKREVAMFGATEAQVKAVVERNLERESRYMPKYQAAAKMATSIMSDAQELMEYDTHDAMQAINRAKWILMEYCY